MGNRKSLSQHGNQVTASTRTLFTEKGLLNRVTPQYLSLKQRSIQFTQRLIEPLVLNVQCLGREIVPYLPESVADFVYALHHSPSECEIDLPM